jgi:hypothetical protein
MWKNRLTLIGAVLGVVAGVARSVVVYAAEKEGKGLVASLLYTVVVSGPLCGAIGYGIGALIDRRKPVGASRLMRSAIPPRSAGSAMSVRVRDGV